MRLVRRRPYDPAVSSDLSIPAWVFVAATLVPWITVLVSLYLGLREIRVKASAEAVEADVKLLRTFGELAPIADARGDSFLSETAVARLLENWSGDEADLDLRAAVAQGTVGAAQQAAVIAAIAELAAKHPLLFEPGRAMLNGLSYLATASNEAVQATYLKAIRRLGDR
jgi:hypothetical protein